MIDERSSDTFLHYPVPGFRAETSIFKTGSKFGTQHSFFIIPVREYSFRHLTITQHNLDFGNLVSL